MTDPKTCSSCGTEPVGPGGILGPSCQAAIASQTTADWYPDTDPS